MLCMINEFIRECLTIRVERRLNSRNVLDELGEVFVRHGPPEHIRSDNGPEFIATALGSWLERLGTKILYIEPGSPWEEAEQKRLWESLFLPMESCVLSRSRIASEDFGRHFSARHSMIVSTQVCDNILE